MKNFFSNSFFQKIIFQIYKFLESYLNLPTKNRRVLIKIIAFFSAFILGISLYIWDAYFWATYNESKILGISLEVSVIFLLAFSMFFFYTFLAMIFSSKSKKEEDKSIMSNLSRISYVGLFLLFLLELIIYLVVYFSSPKVSTIADIMSFFVLLDLLVVILGFFIYHFIMHSKEPKEKSK